MITGFFNINSFMSHDSNNPNVIGDISSVALTYSKNIEEFTSTLGTLYVFDKGGLSGPQITAFNSTCSTIATLLNGIINYTVGGAGLLIDMETALTGSAITVSIGNSILNTIDSKNYPTWVEFTITESALSWTFKVWLSNTDFITNYPLGNIQLIYPFTNLQILYTSYLTAQADVAALTPISMSTIASGSVTGVVTGYASFQVLVQNPADYTANFQFPVLVAYNGGNDYCNQNNYFAQFVTEILASGSYTLDQWLAVIPSLVPVNAYYFVVNWANTSINNGLSVLPLYSPTVAALATTTLATTYFSDYTMPQVENYIEYTTSMYKSLGMYVVPDIGNTDGRVTWQSKFPDYFLVALDDVNYARMSIGTQEMITMLNQLLSVAETFTSGTLPTGVTTLIRGSNTYLCQTLGTVQIRVLTRASTL